MTQLVNQQESDSNPTQSGWSWSAYVFQFSSGTFLRVRACLLEIFFCLAKVPLPPLQFTRWDCRFQVWGVWNSQENADHAVFLFKLGINHPKKLESRRRRTKGSVVGEEWCQNAAPLRWYPKNVFAQSKMILSRAWLHDTVSCAAWNDARKGVYLKPLFKTPCSNCYWGWSIPIMLDYRDISLMESVPLMWGPVTASPVGIEPMTIFGGGPPSPLIIDIQYITARIPWIPWAGPPIPPKLVLKHGELR